jgi:myosin-1
MQFITVVGDGMGGERRQSLGMLSGASHDIRNKLLETNPVLEAFGNARTKRNDNSSRFGKYMELKVDMGTGALVGGKVTNYLLERSRVPSQAPGERNFHIFHYLMAGASSEEVKRLQLLKPGEYRYMCSQAVAPEDGSGLQGVRTALTSVGINEEEQGSVMHLLSAILALGNVDFVDHGDGSAASIVSQECLERAALQLGVPATDLGLALTTSTLRVGRVGGTSQTRHLNAADSATNRDTLAKEIYKRLFDHIVARINASITHTHSCSRQGLLTLGILDIYGFEVMDTNGFEQFCINYVNEKLQQYFVAHTIKAEQDEYVEEGIPWDVIKFFDNAGVCDTIEGRGGLLPLLDEVGSHRSSTAPEFVGTLNSRLGSRPCYILGRDVSYDKAKVSDSENPSWLGWSRRL